MAVSAAKKAANKRWDEANRSRYWRATVVFPVEDKEAVLSRASAKGLTLSDYVRDLIHADMKTKEERR